jgi:putative Holliday junction resolvase
MKYLAIDFGTKNVGLAVSDESEIFSFQHSTIQNDKNLLENLLEIIQRESIQSIVLGLPLGNENKPTQMSNKVLEFKAELEKFTGLTVQTWNEVMTSKQAAQNLSNKDKIDQVSAQIILQEFLEHKKYEKKESN